MNKIKIYISALSFGVLPLACMMVSRGDAEKSNDLGILSKADLSASVTTSGTLNWGDARHRTLVLVRPGKTIPVSCGIIRSDGGCVKYSKMELPDSVTLSLYRLIGHNGNYWVITSLNDSHGRVIISRAEMRRRFMGQAEYARSFDVNRSTREGIIAGVLLGFVFYWAANRGLKKGA